MIAVAKHDVEKSFYNFLQIFQFNVWFALILSFFVYSTFKPYYDRVFLPQLKTSITRSLCLFIKLLFGESTNQKSLPVLVWTICVSLFLVQIFQCLLLGQLVSVKQVWPKNIHELLLEAENHQIITTSLEFFNKTQNIDLPKSASHVIPVYIYDMIKLLKLAYKSDGVFIGRSTEIEYNM